VNNVIPGDDSDWFITHAGNPTGTDRTRSAPSEDENLESSDRTFDKGAATQNELNWMSAVYSSTKVVIDVVKESSDVFPPLKSVASGLTAVLKHYDVRSLSLITFTVVTIASATTTNRKKVVSLIPRVEKLAESLCEAAPESEVKECERRGTLKQ